MHGGKTPRGLTKHKTHGIYEQGLHGDEKELYEHILANKLTSLDEDIAMHSIRLRRLYRAQAQWEDQHGVSLSTTNDGLPVVEQEDEVGRRPGPDGPQEYANRKVIRKRTDFGPEIRSETRLLAELIRTKVMLEAATHGEEARDQLAEDMRLFGEAALNDLEANGSDAKISSGDTRPPSDDRQEDQDAPPAEPAPRSE